ncbi:hypothetical protein B0H13DRAFT_1931811 [Mycena leptocephala]|nr:hypothetical protein B0H13DRAFT_1931811 [Mycena leptocephala]
MANDLMGTAEASLAKSPDTPRSGTTNLLPIRETVNQRHAIMTSWYLNMQPSYRTDDLLAAASCSCFAITAWRGALETRRWPPYPPFFNSHIPLFLPHFLAFVLAALIPPLDPRLDRLISSSRSRRGPLKPFTVFYAGSHHKGQKKEGKIEGGSYRRCVSGAGSEYKGPCPKLPACNYNSFVTDLEGNIKFGNNPTEPFINIYGIDFWVIR